MTEPTLVTVHLTRRFEALPERVFDAWLDAATARTWLFTSPASEKNSTDIDARVGGKWTIADRRDGTDYTATGEYLEIDRPRRLVFTFGMPQFSPHFSRVIVEIAPAGTDCVLRLAQEDVLPASRQGTEDGWGKMFDGLAAMLGERPAFGVVVAPGTIRFERLLPGPIERVWAYLTESDKRGTWLASGEMEPRAGGSVELRFLHASLSTKTAPVPERFKKYAAGHVSRHRVTRFEPPHVLSFTWGDGADGSSEVTFELSPHGDKVMLVLTHRRLAAGAAMAGTAGGWHTHLRVLAYRLDNREPPAFWSIFAETDGVYEKRQAAQ
jgi:uncharacterized protein YndB with AHSA1/START domain